MKYLVAFASSDGVNIDRHFGQADSFVIYELDTELLDANETERRSVEPPCLGGAHYESAFEGVLEVLSDTSAIVAQRAGAGAVEFIRSKGKAIYQIPLTIEQALCIILEDKTWEADKWQYHMRS